MTEETRSQKALKAVNDEIARDRAAVGGMSQEEKRATVAIVLLVAVVVALGIGFARVFGWF